MAASHKRVSRVHYIQHDMNARHDRKIAIAAAALTDDNTDYRHAHSLVYAAFFKLLEIMEESKAHLEISDDNEALYLAGQLLFPMTPEGVNEFRQLIGVMMDAELFDRDFYDRCGKLSSRSFDERALAAQETSERMKMIRQGKSPTTE